MSAQAQKIKLLSDLCQHVDPLATECDGSSRLVALALYNAQIPFKHHSGIVELADQIMPYHEWITALGLSIDYRLRMWFGNEAQHGVFVPQSPLVYTSRRQITFDLAAAELLMRVTPTKDEQERTWKLLQSIQTA